MYLLERSGTHSRIGSGAETAGGDTSIVWLSGTHSRIGSGAETAGGDTSIVWLLAPPQAGSGAFSSWQPSRPAVAMALSVP